MMSILIKNARIINADKEYSQPQNIFCDKGKIVSIGKSESKAGKIIDAGGKWAMPGFIDMHVHLREPGQEHKENIETGSKAAAKGGFTTIMCMPNTDPVIDNRMIVEAIIKESQRVGLTNIYPIGAITKGQKGEELVEMFELKKAGCLALSDDGRCVSNSRLMRLALEYAKMVDILLIQHCEDDCLSCGGVMNEGFNSTLIGVKGVPGISESIIVARDIELTNYLNTKMHFAHMSLKRSVELIREAKKQGMKITAEACPHHFTLTDDELKSFNTDAKVNPPLRSQEDVQAIKEAIADGTIDCIATDHAPHTLEDKEVDLDHAPCGMIGLETALGLALTELVSQDYLTVSQLVQRMSAMPAAIVGLNNKGMIAEGKDADIVIVDSQKKWTVQRSDFISKSNNSPFVGRELTGRVDTTICGGKIVYQV